MAQTGKLIYITPDGGRCKIGSDYTSAPWYQVPDNVKEYIVKIAKGSEVEFESNKDGEKNVLGFIKTAGGAGSTGVAEKKSFTPRPKTSFGGGTESVDRQNSIEKQAMMKTSAEVVSRLFSGQGDFANMDPIWKAIEDGYDRLMKKFNGS